MGWGGPKRWDVFALMLGHGGPKRWGAGGLKRRDVGDINVGGWWP